MPNSDDPHKVHYHASVASWVPGDYEDPAPRTFGLAHPYYDDHQDPPPPLFNGLGVWCFFLASVAIAVALGIWAPIT